MNLETQTYQPQVMDAKSQYWYLDAVSIIGELGGEARAGRFGNEEWVRVGQPVKNFCADNGICYSIRFACIRLPADGWNWLKRMLNGEQYDKAREMFLMSGEEFKRRTDELIADAEKRHGRRVGIPNVC